MSNNIPEVFTKKFIDRLINKVNPEYFGDESSIYLVWNANIDKFKDGKQYSALIKNWADYAKNHPAEFRAFILKYKDYAWKKLEEKHGSAFAQTVKQKLGKIRKILKKLPKSSKIVSLGKNLERSQQKYFKHWKTKEAPYRIAITKFCDELQNLGIDVPNYKALGWESTDMNIYIPRLVCRSVHNGYKLQSVVITYVALIDAAL